MLGCSTECPNCKHKFECCLPESTCCAVKRSLLVLSGGGLITPAVTTTTCLSPQISPSLPVAFVLPGPDLRSLLPKFVVPLDRKPEIELERLSDIVRALRLSGWYHEGLSYYDSHHLLENTKLGTFLVRDSSDSRYLFSLSVQSDRGPVSVRLFYSKGHFRLECNAFLEDSMPRFTNVIQLIEYYVEQTKSCGAAQVWVDPLGKLYSPIKLHQPLYVQRQPPSLKHLARTAVHRGTGMRSKYTKLLACSKMDLPKSVINYLEEYPYSL